MTNTVQLQNISKNELFEHIENIIDKKFDDIKKSQKNDKLSIKEVAKELGVAELTVHNYIKNGKIPAFKIGRRIFIKRLDLENALKEVKSLKYKR